MLRHLLQLHNMTCINSYPEVFYKKAFLKVSQNSQKKSCAEVFFSRYANKNEDLAQVVSCEFCEIGLTSKYKKKKCVQMFPKKVYICFVYT